jgi:hypothetical protein
MIIAGITLYVIICSIILLLYIFNKSKKLEKLLKVICGFLGAIAIFTICGILAIIMKNPFTFSYLWALVIVFLILLMILIKISKIDRLTIIGFLLGIAFLYLYIQKILFHHIKPKIKSKNEQGLNFHPVDAWKVGNKKEE